MAVFFFRIFKLSVVRHSAPGGTAADGMHYQLQSMTDFKSSIIPYSQPRIPGPETEPCLRVIGHQVSGFGRVGSGQGSACQTRCDPVFDPVLSFNMRVYCGIVSSFYTAMSASRQTNICVISCRLLYKNSSGYEIANVNFYAVHPGSYRNLLK